MNPLAERTCFSQVHTKELLEAALDAMPKLKKAERAAVKLSEARDDISDEAVKLADAARAATQAKINGTNKILQCKMDCRQATMDRDTAEIVAETAAKVGINLIVTSGKPRLNMIANLV